MEDEQENQTERDEPLPERPLECTECRRPIAVFYTEIVNKNTVQTAMCADCPVLRHKLFGIPHSEQVEKAKGNAGLACGNCGTSLDAIRVGTPLGCDVCYEVFDGVIIPEMRAANRLPPRVANKKSAPIHIGRSPGQVQEINPSLKLLALNEALNEMLKKEDYEQAAWLRDQIKALTEKQGQERHEKK
jgi:protein arginine kinase activator